MLLKTRCLWLDTVTACSIENDLNGLSRRRGFHYSSASNNYSNQDQVYTLPDGRNIGFAFYGDLASKRSVIYLHGLPGSRVEASDWSKAASHLGVRIIALDRPGYGLSTLHPGRTLSQYPKDILHLVNRLNVSSFSVAGVSGGGPYVLSCAASISSTRLKSAGIVAGLAPPDISPKGGDVGPRATRYMFRYFPNLIAQLSDSRLGKLARMDDPIPMQEMWYKGFKDYKGIDEHIISSREYSHFMASLFRQAFKQGWNGFAEDGKLLNRKWDFKLGDIKHEQVGFYYGDNDVHTPPHMGLEMQKRVQGSRYTEYKDATHLSLVHVHGKAILGNIVEHL